MTAFFEFPREADDISAANAGEALAGLIRRDTGGMPVPGVLGSLTVAAVSASWKVEVSPFTYVRKVGAGVRFSGLSAAEQHDITPAAGSVPAGQARIDLVCWDPVDAEIVVIDGTPASSPSVPSAGGFVALARVRVNSGDGMVIAGQITHVYATTGPVGGGRADQGVVSPRSVPAHGTTSVAVLFKPGTFTETPVITLGASSGARDTEVYFSGESKDGFTLWLGSSSPVARTLGAHWRATQE